MLTFVKEQLEARGSIIIGERKRIPSFIDQRRGKCHEDVNPLDLFAPRIKPIMNTTCFDDQLHSTEVIVLSVWLSASGVAAAVGNCLVLWLFYKHESLRTISNRFIASLSAADFYLGLLISPVWIAVRRFKQPQETDVLAKILDLLWIHTTATTTFNLCCVSVDRFIAIHFPFRYDVIFTKKRCHFAIIFVWIASSLFPLPPISFNVEKLWLGLSVVTFLVPITIVTTCYFWIFKAARKQIRRIKSENSNRQNAAFRAKQNYKALITVGFVLGVFIASWTPCLVLSIWHQLIANDSCLDHKFYVAVWPWIEVVAFTSSSINPWIYCFRNAEFREVLHRRFNWFPSWKFGDKLTQTERPWNIEVIDRPIRN